MWLEIFQKRRKGKKRDRKNMFKNDSSHTADPDDTS